MSEIHKLSPNSFSETFDLINQSTATFQHNRDKECSVTVIDVSNTFGGGENSVVDCAQSITKDTVTINFYRGGEPQNVTGTIKVALNAG